MKKIFCLFFMLMLCGCSAKYEINFNDDIISDNLTVSYERMYETDSQINDLYSGSFYALGREKLYNFKNNSNSNLISLDFDYKYSPSEFALANIPNNCFESFRFIEENNNYYLYVDGKFKCDYYAYEYLDSLDIVISTNHIVIQDNADEKSNGKYIWHINKSSDDFSLRFVVSSKVKSGNFNYILTSLIIVVVCALLIIRKKKFKRA